MAAMIERLAKGMCLAAEEDWDAASYLETANGSDPEEQRDYWRMLARAAIELMRGPTNEMCMAGWKKAEERDAILGNGEVAMLFDAMIETALMEPSA